MKVFRSRRQARSRVVQFAQRCYRILLSSIHNQVVLVGTIVTLMVLGAVIFGRGLDNFLVSDDWTFLGMADAASSLPDLLLETERTWNWWYLRPVEWIVTYLLYHVSGVDPFWYHGASTVVHFVNTVLVGVLTYLLARQTFSATKQMYTWLAVFVAALFAFNWRHHESVFWYSSINELLSVFFRLGTILLLLYWISDRPGKMWTYLGAVVCFALALLSKESAIIALAEVAALPAFFAWASRERVPHTKLVLSWLSFFAVALGWGAYYWATRPSLFQRTGSALDAMPVQHWLLRLVQHLNANFTAFGFVNHNLAFLWAEVLILLAISVLAVVRKRYTWVLTLGWVFSCVVPYVFLVPEIRFDVAGRFLYSSSIPASMWAMFSVVWLEGAVRTYWSDRWARVLVLLAMVLGVLYVGRNMFKLIFLEREWQTAGEISAGIVGDIVAQHPDPDSGDVWCFENVPDNYHNKYVFRNGIEPALYLAYGRRDFTVERLDSSRAPARSKCMCVFETEGFEVFSRCSE